MELTPEEIRAVQKRENWQNECEYIDALFQAQLAKLQMSDEQVREEVRIIIDTDPIGATDKLTALIAAQKAQAKQELIKEIERYQLPDKLGYYPYSGLVAMSREHWQEIKDGK